VDTGGGPYPPGMTPLPGTATPAYPPKPVPGDRIAVISPSAALPRILGDGADPATFESEPETRPGSGWTIPYGGMMRIDGPARRITVTY